MPFWKSKYMKPSNIPCIQVSSQEFFGQESFFELGHLDKHSPTTLESKAPQGKNTDFVAWKLLKVAF